MKKKARRLLWEALKDSSSRVHKATGYKLVYNSAFKDIHPSGRKEFRYHRILWEIVNKEFLREKDDIHHIDGRKLNNRPSNLEKMDRKSHRKLHRKHFGCKVKGCDKIHYGLGYCRKHYLRVWRKRDDRERR